MSAFYNVDQPPFNMSSAARAIAAANNGLLFDIGDMSYLYQDAAGTTPVTAVEQPVGKILDKSGKGNHATQSITASRPTLSARYNLLTKTENFTNTSFWVTSSDGTTVTSGLNNLRESGGVTFHRVRYISATVVAGTTYTFSFTFAPVNLRYVAIRGSSIGGNTQIAFDIQNLAVTYADSGRAGSVYDAGNGFVTVTCTVSPTASLVSEGLIFSDTKIENTTIPTYAADASRGVDNLKAQLELGSSAGPYQRVNTATDYDTDPRYFPKYLRFDGVDDYLNLPYMGLYGGGAASIICARDAVSQSVDTYILSERSTTDADPKYFPSRQLASAGNMDAYISDDAGAAVLDTVGSPFSGVVNAVIRSIVDSGNNIKLFKNGVLAANDKYTRSGTLTLNNTTLGASVSTTTSNYASMKLYGLIVTKSALTDAQRVRCERFLARKAGVIL